MDRLVQIVLNKSCCLIKCIATVLREEARRGKGGIVKEKKSRIRMGIERESEMARKTRKMRERENKR